MILSYVSFRELWSQQTKNVLQIRLNYCTKSAMGQDLKE
ncbi:hypothetical protein M595_5927 [Lyngbya aestuarii BL J]|uniref:Uncharacterized protein n=1 Tax=Lyngbya aestuarii BL J TaxID=1348334 RepID=U7Q8K5_9CYAN|nr:hypothetical protein M595_6364 [Lyngbya aestuarii BL J]ERT04128.1 hypothetical protein M595_5927 [Lyngbya aestuarii BL J]